MSHTRLMRAAPLAVALGAATFFPGCVVGGGFLTVSDVQEETRRLDPDGVFLIDNTNGRVQVDTWEESRVRITATKRAPSRASLRRIEIEIEGEGQRVSVRTRLPKVNLVIGGSSQVDYRVTLPRTARVEVESTNGRVDLDGVRGEISVRTVNGRITIDEAERRVRASTVNGSIRASYARPDANAHHRFETTNGSIRVSLPEGAGGRLEASTTNGSIRDDVELSDRNKRRRRLEGRLGAGEGSFDLRTVNGSIRIAGLAAAREAEDADEPANDSEKKADKHERGES